MATTRPARRQRPPRFREPEPSVTPQERRRFTTLAVLAVLVVVLFWVVTLPFNLRPRGPEAAGPNELISTIGEGFAAGTNAMKSKTEGLTNQTTSNQ